MIISKIYKGQGLGNQLWCMITAYALSIKKNFECTFIDNSNSFLGNEIFNLSENFFLNDTKIKYQYFEKCFYDKNLKTNLFYFDKDIINVRPFTEIIGNFQSESYLFNKEKEIKDFFHLSDKTIKLSSQFKKFNVLNIRGGEYKLHRELLLSDSYWKNLYNLLKNKSDLPIIIVSDDYHYSKKLFPKLEIISNDLQMCFAAIMGSKNIGLSNSSFSYFPIFFGQKKNTIYGPFQWSRFNNKSNLWVSPCNYYSDWQWINSNGEIVNNNLCIKNIEKTMHYLHENSKKINFTPSKNDSKIIITVKNIIKKFMGYFNWRYR